MVSVTVPEGIVGDYRATVRGQDFDCFVLSEYPDRLYCIGPEPKGEDEALLMIFQAEVDEAQFEAVFAIPQRPADNGAGAATAIVQFGDALGNNYGPSTVTINVGDIVEWRGDFSAHPLVSDGGLWGTVSSGSAFSFTFNSAGTYTYHCQVHQALGMTGEVIVLTP